jgi:hypothetical protein
LNQPWAAQLNQPSIQLLQLEFQPQLIQLLVECQLTQLVLNWAEWLKSGCFNLQYNCVLTVEWLNGG